MAQCRACTGNSSHKFAAALRNPPGAKALAQLGANARDIVLAERVIERCAYDENWGAAWESRVNLKYDKKAS